MKFLQPIKEFFGEKNELVASVDIALEERITSPFYGYFIISWLIINWKLIFIAFFVSQDKIFEKKTLLRHEYLLDYFPNFASINHWLYFLIYPLLLTVFFFWIFPYVTRFFYRKRLRNQIELKIVELQEIRKEKKEEKKLVEEETDLIKIKAEQEKQKKKVERETPEVLWQREFNEFKKLNIYGNFGQLKDIVYGRSGNTHRFNGATYIRTINTDFLALLHTRGLIILNGSGSSERIELTEKGMFFMAKYLESIS